MLRKRGELKDLIEEEEEDYEDGDLTSTVGLFAFIVANMVFERWGPSNIAAIHKRGGCTISATRNYFYS